MRQTSKNKIILEELANNLIKGETIFAVGLKEPDDYIKRLKEDFNINVIAIPKYMKPSENNRFHFNQNTVTEYLPTIIGYEFSIHRT